MKSKLKLQDRIEHLEMGMSALLHRSLFFMDMLVTSGVIMSIIKALEESGDITRAELLKGVIADYKKGLKSH